MCRGYDVAPLQRSRSTKRGCRRYGNLARGCRIRIHRHPQHPPAGGGAYQKRFLQHFCPFGRRPAGPHPRNRHPQPRHQRRTRRHIGAWRHFRPDVGAAKRHQPHRCTDRTPQPRHAYRHFYGGTCGTAYAFHAACQRHCVVLRGGKHCGFRRLQREIYGRTWRRQLRHRKMCAIGHKTAWSLGRHRGSLVQPQRRLYAQHRLPPRKPLCTSLSSFAKRPLATANGRTAKEFRQSGVLQHLLPRPVRVHSHPHRLGKQHAPFRQRLASGKRHILSRARRPF